MYYERENKPNSTENKIMFYSFRPFQELVSKFSEKPPWRNASARQPTTRIKTLTFAAEAS